MSYTNSEDHADDLTIISRLLSPLNTISLICVVIFVVYSQSIPIADLAFSVLFSSYLFAANIFRFDQNAPAIRAGKKHISLLRQTKSKTWFYIYIGTFAFFGLFLPFFLLIAAPISIGAAAAPHFYLLMCQILMEHFTNTPNWAAFIRLLVPVGFNAYRIIALLKWAENAWLAAEAVEAHREPIVTMSVIAIWHMGAVTLALFNLILWTYNLFIFLLLRITPLYIDPVEFPSAPVRWRAHLVPVLLHDANKAEYIQKKK